MLGWGSAAGVGIKQSAVLYKSVIHIFFSYCQILCFSQMNINDFFHIDKNLLNLCVPNSIYKYLRLKVLYLHNINFSP